MGGGGLGRATTHHRQRGPAGSALPSAGSSGERWVHAPSAFSRRATHVLLTICRRSPFLKDRSVSVRDS